MERYRSRLQQELTKFIEPVYPNHVVASAYCSVALALILVYVYKGSAIFFTYRISTYLLPSVSTAEIEWWAVIYQFVAAFLLFFVLPTIALKLLAREKLRELGMGLGDWRFSLTYIIPIGLLIAAINSQLVASDPEFTTTYPMAKLAMTSTRRLVAYELAYGLLYYLAYEAFFRGFVQCGLAKRIGDNPAILVQTAMTTLIHIGKPFGEIWYALIGGYLFGMIVARTRSIWAVFIIHWALGIMTDLGCAHAAGIW